MLSLPLLAQASAPPHLSLCPLLLGCRAFGWFYVPDQQKLVWHHTQQPGVTSQPALNTKPMPPARPHLYHHTQV